MAGEGGPTVDLNLEIKRELASMAEPEFRKFEASLLPGVENIIGVRLPSLRKLAKKLSKDEWRSYLECASDDTFEEIMLQGMVIGLVKTDVDEALRYAAEFVRKIDNWTVCDTFCTGLKVAKRHQDRVLEFVLPYLSDRREYHVRFGVVMLLAHYVNDFYIDTVLKVLDRVCHEGYYVKMAVAWAVSVCYVKFPSLTMEYLKNNCLDDDTYNKALRKIVESSKVDKGTKDMIRAMKR